MGLITLSDELQVLLSDELMRRCDEFIQTIFHPLKNRTIEVPSRFSPDIRFLQFHRDRIFLG